MRVLGENKPLKRTLKQGDVFRDTSGDISIMTDENKAVVLVGDHLGLLWKVDLDFAFEIYPDAAIVLYPRG